MRLRDLLTRTDWNEVKLSLLRYYPDAGQNIEGHRHVFGELLSLTPRQTNMRLCHEEVFREGIDEKQHIEVSGKDGTLNRDLPDFRHFSQTMGTELANSETSYALELVPWEEWLDMEIDPATLEAYAGEDIIAHCLWEMTFFGFDQDAVKEQGEELRRRADGLKNRTDEEGKQKLVPSEEVRRELDRLVNGSERTTDDK